MKLYMYTFKNLFLGCCGQIKFDDHDPETFGIGQKRALLIGDEEKVFPFENTELYCLGVFDDEKMSVSTEGYPFKLLDCNEVLSERKLKSKLIEAAKERDKKEGAA